ncbi:MAG: phosphoenolpyruvate carboxykinase, partial [Desulfobacteria bacterium]
MSVNEVLESKLDSDSLGKLLALNNTPLNEIIADAIVKFQPDSVFVSTGSPENSERVREQAVRLGEEKSLVMSGHTIH